MKITTKIGDSGETTLYRGMRCSKADSIIDALGNLDELQSWLGMCRCKIIASEKKRSVLRIQKDIYRIMTAVGNFCIYPKGVKLINKSDVRFLEKEIEKMEKELIRKKVGLDKFIIPGENEISSYLDIVRTVCRRAERSFVTYIYKKKLDVGEKSIGAILKYLNRLSDLLFLWGKV